MSYLEAGDRESVYAGLQGLFALTARFEFELDEDRDPLHEIIRESFSHLGSLVGQMLDHKNDADALYMLHLICKVFYVSNQLQMSPYLMDAENLDPWIHFFKTILDLPCPPDLSSSTEDPAEIDRREKHIFWKIKGITAKLTYRAFVKYGNPSLVEEKPEIQAFSSKFSLNFNVPLLESHLTNLLNRRSAFVGAKALNFAIKFTSASTKLANTMEKLKPFVQLILHDTVVPILYVTTRDLEQFETEPIEYIRAQYDFQETLFQPKNQIQDLMCYLCKYSSIKKKKGKKKAPKPDYLGGFLQFALDNLNTYATNLQAGTPTDWRIKEALMFAIGTIRDEIVS